MAKFNPHDYLTKIQGRDYLQVCYRIMWFREDYPQGTITTEPGAVGSYVYVRARVIVDGVELASGIATVREATDKEKTWAGRIFEKAETTAIGRALAVAGYGTQFTEEGDDGDDLANAPIERRPKSSTNGHKADAELTWPHESLIEQVKALAMRVFDIKVWSDDFLCGKKWSDFESGKAAGAAIAACVEALRNPTPEVLAEIEAGTEVDAIFNVPKPEPVAFVNGQAVEPGKSPFAKSSPAPAYSRIECRADQIAIGDIIHIREGRLDYQFEVKSVSAAQHDANGKHYPLTGFRLDTGKASTYKQRWAENTTNVTVVGGPKFAPVSEGGTVEQHAGRWLWTPARTVPSDEAAP